MEKNRLTLDASLDALLDGIMLSERDQSLFHAIVHGVMRWKGVLDAVIEHFSSRPLKRIEPEILNIIRIALFQIRYLDKIPVSAAVNTAVDLTKSSTQSKATGFVNALLRAAAATSWEFLLPDPAVDPVGWLSRRFSYPEWMVSRWVDRMGFIRAKAFCDAQNQIPPITVRVNRLKTDRENLVHRLKDHCARIEPCKFSPDGISIAHPAGAISSMTPFREGMFQVQDEAAQLVTFLLDPQPGETVLDACAGLGGKTGHIAQRMNNSGRLVAWDIHGEKLKKLSGEMHRLGVTMVVPERRDLLALQRKENHMNFDRVLLDAPCSGLGVIRRNPDARWNTVEADLLRHQQTQSRLLEGAAALVKTGGVLVYSVCSKEPEENEIVIEAFLDRHPDFQIHAGGSCLPRLAQGLMKDNRYLSTNPMEHDMDGFFISRMERKA